MSEGKDGMDNPVLTPGTVNNVSMNTIQLEKERNEAGEQ
jgi:hypothetical protein